MPRQILLADDSATIARMVQITFAHEDYAVTAVRSGDEAVARARMAKPDIVLIDAGLPGKTGYDVCGELRAAGLSNVPVLILTNNFVPYDEARGQKAGADGFVVKPFDTTGLIDRVSQAISQRGSGARPVAAAPVAQPSQPAAPVAVSQPARPAAVPAPIIAPPVSQPIPVQPAAPSMAARQAMITPPNMPAVTPPPAQRPAPVAPARAVAPPVAAAPPPAARPPESVANLRPKATLMGLPTVGPDGLPITLTPPPPAQPAVAAPARPVATPSTLSPMGSPAAAPPSARPPQTAAATAATMMMQAPTLPSRPDSTQPLPRNEPSSPIRPSPSPSPSPIELQPAISPSRVERAAPSDFASGSTLPGPAPRIADSLNEGPAPVIPPPVIAPPISVAPVASPAAAAAGPARRAQIPASAPRMPRPSLVPNAPSPEVLRQIVQNVASAAGPRVMPHAQALGAHPEYEAIARLSREVIEQIAWEVVPELAEVMIKAELDRLVRERTRS